MRIVFIVLTWLSMACVILNAINDEPEAARFNIIMCGIFTILQKLYA